MKKFLLAIILFSSVCNAQDTVSSAKKKHCHFFNFLKDTIRKRHFFVSVNGGLGIPTLDYGKYNGTSSLLLLNNYSHAEGYAVNGLHTNFTTGYFLIPQLALVAKAGLDISSIDDRIFDKVYPRYAFDGGFRIWQFMGGIITRFKIHKKTYVYAQEMAGIIYANFPTFSLSDTLGSYSIGLNNSISFACNFCVGFENVLTRTISWNYNFGYTFSEFKYPSRVFSVPGASFTYNQPVTMAYGSMQLTVGFLFHL